MSDLLSLDFLYLWRWRQLLRKEIGERADLEKLRDLKYFIDGNGSVFEQISWSSSFLPQLFG